jgi:hypothetical protein
VFLTSPQPARAVLAAIQKPILHLTSFFTSPYSSRRTCRCCTVYCTTKRPGPIRAVRSQIGRRSGDAPPPLRPQQSRPRGHVHAQPSRDSGQCSKLHHLPLFYPVTTNKNAEASRNQKPSPLICTLPKSPHPLHSPPDHHHRLASPLPLSLTPPSRSLSHPSMRIRRRPQPSPQLGSDPTTTSTAPQTTPQNAARGRGWLDPGGGGGGVDREAAGNKPLLHAGADLAHKSGVARRLALPQVLVYMCARLLILPCSPPGLLHSWRRWLDLAEMNQSLVFGLRRRRTMSWWWIAAGAWVHNTNMELMAATGGTD